MNVKALVPEPIKDVVKTMLRSRLNRDSYVCHEYLGHRILMNMRDGVARNWYDKDWLEAERREFAAIARCGLPADGMAFNLGAHHGLVSMLIRKRLLPDGKVIAVEIDRLNYGLCRNNIVINHIADIDCVNAAIAHTESYVQFKGMSNNTIDLKPSILRSLFGMKIRSMSIDQMCHVYGWPVLIYMDIEGAEVLAIRGAIKALGRVKVWFIELHGDLICAHFGGRNVEIGSALLDNGYALSLSRKEQEDFTPINSVKDIPADRCYVIAAR